MNSSGTTKQHVIGLLVVATCIRIIALVAMSSSLAADPDGYAYLAENLSQHLGYGFYVDTSGALKPTAYRPPLYPLVIATPVALSPESHLWVGVLQGGLGVATALLVWQMALRMRMPAWAGGLAGVLVAADPILVNQQAQVMTETLAAFLVMVAWHALALAFATENDAASRRKWFVAAGAMLGLCMLCRPTFAAWLVLVVVVAIAVKQSQGSNRFAAVALVLAGAAIVFAPWTIRNRIQLQHTILTTSHGGFTLLLANNPDFYQHLVNDAWGSVWTPGNTIASLPGANWRDLASSSSKDKDELRPDPKTSVALGSAASAFNQLDGADFDEVAHDVQYNRQAWENIRAEPARFAYACLVRLGRLWGILPHQLTADESRERRLLRYAVALWYAIELPLAAFALWSLGGSLRRSPWIWAAVLLVSVSAMHLLYWTDLRMRAPLMPVVALLAARAVVVLAAGFRHPNPDTVKV